MKNSQETLCVFKKCEDLSFPSNDTSAQTGEEQGQPVQAPGNNNIFLFIGPRADILHSH